MRLRSVCWHEMPVSQKPHRLRHIKPKVRYWSLLERCDEGGVLWLLTLSRESLKRFGDRDSDVSVTHIRWSRLEINNRQHGPWTSRLKVRDLRSMMHLSDLSAFEFKLIWPLLRLDAWCPASTGPHGIWTWLGNWMYVKICKCWCYLSSMAGLQVYRYPATSGGWLPICWRLLIQGILRPTLIDSTIKTDQSHLIYAIRVTSASTWGQWTQHFTLPHTIQGSVQSSPSVLSL